MTKPCAQILSIHSVVKISKNRFSTYSSKISLIRFVSPLGNGVWAPNATQLAQIVIKMSHSKGVLQREKRERKERGKG